jgi:origin recognition complex subunit 5
MLEEASSSQPRMRYARLDGVACFSSRVLYDSVINKIAKHVPTWDDGGDNWGTERYNESLDAFLHGLRAVSEQVAKDQAILSNSVRSILLLENAEHMKDSIPELLVPLARLAELVSP